MTANLYAKSYEYMINNRLPVCHLPEAPKVAVRSPALLAGGNWNDGISCGFRNKDLISREDLVIMQEETLVERMLNRKIERRITKELDKICKDFLRENGITEDDFKQNAELKKYNLEINGDLFFCYEFIYKGELFHRLKISQLNIFENGAKLDFISESIKRGAACIKN